MNTYLTLKTKTFFFNLYQVQQNEYSQVDSRFEDITKLVTSDDAERNITNVSYDEENSIYHEVKLINVKLKLNYN